MNVVRTQLQSQPFEIVVHQRRPYVAFGYRLAYVLLKSCNQTPIRIADPVLFSYDQPLPPSNECSESNLPSHEQVLSLLDAVNDQGAHFELIKFAPLNFL